MYCTRPIILKETLYSVCKVKPNTTEMFLIIKKDSVNAEVI